MSRRGRRDAEAAYDTHHRDDLRDLANEAATAGHAFETDHGDGSACSIHADSDDAKQRAHDRLATLPDIGNWIP